MSLDALLIHTCTIARAAQTTTDPYGNSVSQWADRHTDVPCRLIDREERILNDERTDSTVVTHYLLLVGAEVDIQEQDRVKVIVNGGERTFMVLNVLARNGISAQYHKSISLLKVGE